MSQGADINTVLHKLNYHIANDYFIPPKIKDYSGILSKPNAGTPNSQIDEAWTSLYIEGTDLGAFSGTIDITNTGALGLDANDTEASSTWYHRHAIASSDFQTVSAMLSSNKDAPVTMPDGYTKSRWTGPVYNDGSSNFVAYGQQNDTYTYDSHILILNTGSSSVGWAALGLTTVMPDASLVDQVLGTFYYSAANGNNMSLRGYINGAYRGGQLLCAILAGGAFTGSPFRLETETQGIQYYTSLSSSAALAVGGLKLIL
jgi:hypothetical protein